MKKVKPLDHIRKTIEISQRRFFYTLKQPYPDFVEIIRTQACYEK